ncbi:MAG TPA: hypothetical protein VKA09_15055 [Nitrososphaeraceae archaeon]|nr:hypothetical protein [Nitrososphaeraceae archaeon]
MKKHLVLTMLAVLGSAIVLSFFATTSAFAQDTPYSEEYMAQHDGGDRAEYLQEMEHSDPWFYVPPVNDASISSSTPSPTTNNTVPAN